MENLYLKWKDYKTNEKHIIGALCRDKKNNKYYFKLNEGTLKRLRPIAKQKNVDLQLLHYLFQMLTKYMKVIYYFLFLELEFLKLKKWMKMI